MRTMLSSGRFTGSFVRSRNVVLKMLEGAQLTADEEEMLLIKID